MTKLSALSKIIKEYRYNIIFSIISSLLLILGKVIYNNHSIDSIVNHKIIYFFIFIIFFMIFSFIYELIKLLYFKYLNTHPKTQKNTITNKTIIIMAILLIIVYGICYISFYPGIFSYDMPKQDPMAKGEIPLTNHHPVLHTLIWKFFLTIKNITNIPYIEIVGYSLFQLTIVIITYIVLIKWLCKNNYSNRFVYITFLYYLLNPILHVFSFNPTKDVLFACMLQLFLISIIDLLTKNKTNYIGVFVFSFLLCMFRNNGIYGLIALIIPILALSNEKKSFFKISKAYNEDKKAVIALFSTIILYFLIVNALFPLLKIKNSSVAEKLSIPLMHLSNVYVNTDTFNNEEKEAIKKFVPNIEKFNYRISDYVKNDFNEEYYLKNKKEYSKLITKAVLNNKKMFITTALDLNIQYWYYGADIIDPYNDRVYIGDKLYNEEEHNKLPSIFKSIHTYYNKVDNASIWYMNIPIFNTFFKLAFCYWVLTIALYLSLIRKDKLQIKIIIFLFAIFTTYIVGPTAIFRYVYPYYFILPLIIGIILKKENTLNSVKVEVEIKGKPKSKPKSKAN